MTPSQEQQLVEDAKTNGESFGKLYDYYFPKIYGFIASKTRDRSDAEDLTGEVFMKALEHIGTYEWRGFPFSAWLFTIARNTLANHYSKSAKNRHSELDDTHYIADENKDISPKRVAMREELAEKVKEIMAELPERELNVMQLKFFGQLSNREIVKVTGLSESNVAVILFRTLKKIRPDLQNYL